jgi:lysophospholipase L1-like esterase
MKTILCYGDSNTWGCTPVTGVRYPKDVRWPGVLAAALGDKFEVVEEGLPGRTTVWDDPIMGWMNGKSHLLPCLGSHKPIDLIIIFLGTNDLKTYFSLPAYAIAQGAGKLVEIAMSSETGPNGNPPEVLLLAPPPLGQLNADRQEEFKDGWEKSMRFTELYKQVADLQGCHYYDTSRVIVSSNNDGIHLEKSEHLKLGLALAEVVRDLFG